MVGLDPRSARLTKDLLRASADAGVTIFMSTHTLSVAEEVAHRIGILRKGHLVALGTLDEIKQAHAQDLAKDKLEDLFLDLTASE